jgi:hypothetical protein
MYQRERYQFLFPRAEFFLEAALFLEAEAFFLETVFLTLFFVLFSLVLAAVV